MSQKTKKQLQTQLDQLTKEKEELMAAKKANSKTFSPEQQQRLNEVTEAIVDLEEQIELAGEEPETSEKPVFEVPKGTEKMVHLMLAQGNRFDPKTGKEINFPNRQSFTYGEWQLFKKNFKQLGYTITEVLHDPYGEAKALLNQ